MVQIILCFVSGTVLHVPVSGPSSMGGADKTGAWGINSAWRVVHHFCMFCTQNNVNFSTGWLQIHCLHQACWRKFWKEWVNKVFSACSEGPDLCSILLTLCSVVLILVTLPLSLLFSVKVVQVQVWWDFSRAYMWLFRSMRGRSSLDLVAFCPGVLEVLECSLSFLVWIFMRK